MAGDLNTSGNWFTIDNENEVFSPSLLVYPDRVEQNIIKMLDIAGDAARVWPHVKTHKSPDIVRMQLNHGITRFKCATIAEAEMVAKCGAQAVMLAIQPVGPNQRRLVRLIREFPAVSFSCIADSETVVSQLSGLAAASRVEIPVWIDINCGMNRTGIAPGDKAVELFQMADTLPGLKVAGLHVYDGHIHEPDLAARTRLCYEAFKPVDEMIARMKNITATKIRVVAGGTPTFPVHASRKDLELSPGTFTLWDYGYGSTLTDLEFLHAAVLFTRVISKPADDLLCIDLGHKAVGSEMSHPRVSIPGMEGFTVVTHNEEHMTIRTGAAGNFKTGDAVYCIPWHICPTVDRHDFLYVVRSRRVTGIWKVEARKRIITI